MTLSFLIFRPSGPSSAAAPSIEPDLSKSEDKQVSH